MARKKVKGADTDHRARVAKHSQTSVEHYSPPEVVERARTVLGGIDLDPASCAKANEIIQAEEHFHELSAPGSLVRPWHGTVFLNPPGGITDDEDRRVLPKCRETGACGLSLPHEHPNPRSATKKWWEKLWGEYAIGRVREAMFLAFNIEFLQTSQDTPRPVMTLPFCVPAQRLRFLYVDGASSGFKVGGGPTHANAIIYLPPLAEDRRPKAVARFVREFRSLGTCVVP